MKSFKVTDKDGNVYIMTPVDTEARQAINEAKNLQFDMDYFTSEVSQDETTVNVGLNGVPIGVDSDSPLKFVQDNDQGIVFGSDAPFSTSIAPEYDASSTYAVGDPCMHLGKYYKCNTAISTAEEWEPLHWRETTVADEIPDIPTGDKVWAHWENNDNWHDVVGWYTFPNSDYHKSEGVLTDSQYPYLKAGLYRFTMEVALRNYPTAYDAVQKFDITIKYGAQELRAQSFMFDRTIPFGDGIVETVWFGGIFRMPAEGTVSVYVESPDNLPANMKCSHIFINKIGD